jgi:hypothetical protein
MWIRNCNEVKQVQKRLQEVQHTLGTKELNKIPLTFVFGVKEFTENCVLSIFQEKNPLI